MPPVLRTCCWKLLQSQTLSKVFGETSHLKLFAYSHGIHILSSLIVDSYNDNLFNNLQSSRKIVLSGVLLHFLSEAKRNYLLQAYTTCQVNTLATAATSWRAFWDLWLITVVTFASVYSEMNMSFSTLEILAHKIQKYFWPNFVQLGLMWLFWDVKYYDIKLMWE